MDESKVWTLIHILLSLKLKVWAGALSWWKRIFRAPILDILFAVFRANSLKVFTHLYSAIFHNDAMDFFKPPVSFELINPKVKHLQRWCNVLVNFIQLGFDFRSCRLFLNKNVLSLHGILFLHFGWKLLWRRLKSVSFWSYTTKGRHLLEIYLTYWTTHVWYIQ